MSRPAFLQKEPLTRMGLAFLLTVGIVAPLLLALDLGGQMLLALAEALGLLVLLTTLSGNRKTRIVLWVLLAGAALYYAVERPFLRLRERMPVFGRAVDAPAPAIKPFGDAGTA